MENICQDDFGTNMIVEDEWDDPDLNDDYLFEDANFTVDDINHDDVAGDSELITANMLETRKKYMSTARSC